MATYNRLLWTASGSEKLLKARLVVQAAFALSATNYWTVTLRRRRVATAQHAAQATGETLGTYTLNTRSLVADTPVTLYENEQGLALADTEKLVATFETTGSPAALDNPTLLLDWQRNTR